MMPETLSPRLPRFKRAYCVLAFDATGNLLYRRTYQSSPAAIHRARFLREQRFWRGAAIDSITVTTGYITWDHTEYGWEAGR
jgi:hypothetical protein